MNNSTTKILLFILFFTVCYFKLPAQEINRMYVVGKAELIQGEIVGRDIKDKNGEWCGGLIISTDLTGLIYDSNNGIIKIDRKPGRDLLYLSPKEAVVEIFNTGYQSLRIILSEHNISIRSGEVWKLEVTGTKTGLTRADENLFDVVFSLNQSSVYSWYGSLAPILSQSNIISYKLPQGEYTFHFQKEGFAPVDKKIDVTNNISENISLVEGASSITNRLSLPGIAVLTTEPTNSEIFLNGLKIGTTPYQGNLQPGIYEMEIRKVFYHTDYSQFVVEEGKTVSLNILLKPKFGFLNVNSNITGSSVILDGKNIGNTPINRYQLESIPHSIRVEANLYHSYTEEFTIADDEVKSINAILKPAFGSLKVESLPESGADVFLDGNKVGQTPYTNERLASGRYLLKVTKELYRDFEESIIINDGDIINRNIPLDRNFGELIIFAQGSQIYINDKLAGKDKVTQKLNAGRYTLSAVKDDKHYKAVEEVFLAIGDKKEITLKPVPKLGGVSIFVEPSEAMNAVIYIDDERKGTAPLILPLLVGQYRVTAKKDNYLDVTESFTLRENEEKKITLQMLTYEGSRLQIKNRWATVKWISLGSAAVLGGASYYFNNKANNYFDNYKGALTTEDALNYRKLTDDNTKLRDVFIYSATAAMSAALITWLIELMQ